MPPLQDLLASVPCKTPLQNLTWQELSTRSLGKRCMRDLIQDLLISWGLVTRPLWGTYIQDLFISLDTLRTALHLFTGPLDIPGSSGKTSMWDPIQAIYAIWLPCLRISNDMSADLLQSTCASLRILVKSVSPDGVATLFGAKIQLQKGAEVFKSHLLKGMKLVWAKTNTLPKLDLAYVQSSEAFFPAGSVEMFGTWNMFTGRTSKQATAKADLKAFTLVSSQSWLAFLLRGAKFWARSRNRVRDSKIKLETETACLRWRKWRHSFHGSHLEQNSNLVIWVNGAN